jgi:hypothetical protein
VRHPADPACPSTVEALILGGANDVCGPPSGATPSVHAVTLALGAALGVAVAMALLGRARLSARRSRWLVLGAALVAAPGAHALLVDRADAPLRARSTATAIAGLLDDMSDLAASQRGCVGEIPGGCVACQPLLRFVLPERPPCPGAPRDDGRRP